MQVKRAAEGTRRLIDRPGRLRSAAGRSRDREGVPKAPQAAKINEHALSPGNGIKCFESVFNTAHGTETTTR